MGLKMKKAPTIIWLDVLLPHYNRPMTEIDGSWVPARPLGFFSIWHRIRCAWLVFTGKGDVLIWPRGQ